MENDLVGRKCKIHIKINDTSLFYTATILSINNHSVTFCDRHNDIFLYNMANVMEINDAHQDQTKQLTEFLKNNRRRKENV